MKEASPDHNHLDHQKIFLQDHVSHPDADIEVIVKCKAQQQTEPFKKFRS